MPPTSPKIARPVSISKSSAARSRARFPIAHPRGDTAVRALRGCGEDPPSPRCYPPWGENPPAPDRDHRARIFAQNTIKRFFRDAPVAGLSVQRKNLRQVHPRVFFDFLVEFDERNFEIFGQLGAERRFSRAAQADQRNSPAPGQIVFSKFAAQTRYDRLELRAWNPFQNPAK